MEINCSCIATGEEDKCLDCWGTLKRDTYVGLPVVYVPDHCHVINEDRDYRIPVLMSEGVEWGFVTSDNGKFVFCRYFMGIGRELRTTGNSEATSPEGLYAIEMGKRAGLIRRLLKELGYEEPERDEREEC